MEHADPEFYRKWEFCRIDCPECDRLDREEIASGVVLTREDRVKLVKKVIRSFIEEGG